MRKGESSTEERSVRERHVLSRFCINRRTKRRSFRKLSVKSPVSNFQLACMTLVKRRCGGNGDFTTASGTPIKDRDYRDFPLKLSRFTPPASLSLSLSLSLGCGFFSLLDRTWWRRFTVIPNSTTARFCTTRFSLSEARSYNHITV